MIDENIQINRGNQVKIAPRVSIIIPAYNVTQYISEALDSVFAQTFTDYEIVVINDGSPDTSELEQVLEPYQERIIYAKQENRGVSGARNTGIQITTAPFIAQLDPDDAWMPNYLEVQMGIIESDPTIDVLYPNAVIFGDTPEAGKELMSLSPSNGEVTFERLILQECNVITCVTARRESFLRAGLFDESLRSSEDFDLWLRIVKQGGRLAYHRQVLARYRRREGSHTSNSIWMCNHFLRVLEKSEKTLNLTAKEHQSLLQSRNRVQAELTLCEGKSAFFKGDVKTAVKRFTEANVFFKSRKIALLIQLLPIAPRFLLHLYNARDRYFYKANTKIVN
jgi:glycosyltransferase involved in cell wall biosynthesis